MNKRRKVLITITYNEMGIIIDTKAEEVAQPNLQSTCNELATDCISRQAAIDALGEEPYVRTEDDDYAQGMRFQWKSDHDAIEALSSAQPEVLACGEGVLNAQPERWIPVTERLPEVSGSYLVSEHSPLGEFTCTRYWNQGDRRGYWSGDGYSTVTAWMPLPEPYQAERREE